jgi:predicted DNA-binding transcriptional regulator AlpA
MALRGRLRLSGRYALLRERLMDQLLSSRGPPGGLTTGGPQSHHLDKRASDIAARIDGGGDKDELLSTEQTATLLGVSRQWLEIGRTRGYGVPFVRLSPRRVRYRRSDVIAWLNERTHHATAEYSSEWKQRPGRMAGSKVVGGKVVACAVEAVDAPAE